MILRCSRIGLACVMLGGAAWPAAAQPYGYDTPGPPPPPPQAYQPPPGAYAPQPYAPPGSRCHARFPDGQPLLCRMRVSKPVGAPCRCIAPPPPGYPPEPAVPGRVGR